MAIGDSVLAGEIVRAAAMTAVQRLTPPDSAVFSGPAISQDAALVGWNSAGTGFGVVGRGAPSGVGVVGRVNPGTPAIAGDTGVFGTAQSTGVMGTASLPVVIDAFGGVTGGTGIAGLATAGGVGAHGRAMGGTGTEIGVVGSSDSGTGVAGFAPGDGVVGQTNGSGAGVRGRANSADGVGVVGEGSTEGAGVVGEGRGREGVVGRTSSGFAGVRGESVGPGVLGMSDEWHGVVGISQSDVRGGVLGITDAPKNGVGFGVTGYASAGGTGVVGESRSGPGVVGLSDTDAGVLGSASNSVGVYGSSDRVAGVRGTSQRGAGVIAQSGTGVGLVATAANRTGTAGLFLGNVYISGNLVVAGNKNAAVRRASEKHRLLYCVESPESWLEDFGEARLVNGRARVSIDRGFAATIDARSYHVFVSGYGPEPVFVSKRGRDAFEIRIVPRAGVRVPRSLRCSFRIVARRRAVKARRLQPLQWPSAPRLKAPVPREPSRMRSARLGGRLAVRARGPAQRSRRTDALKEPTFPRVPRIRTEGAPSRRRRSKRGGRR